MKSLLFYLVGLLASGAAVAAQLPSLQVSDASAQAQAGLPVTVGHVFAKGDVKPGETITASVRGVAIPLQADVKATHADGSMRHAVLTAVLPQLGSGETAEVALATMPMPVPSGGTGPGSLLASGFNAVVRLNVGGVIYTADAAQLLASKPYKTWLAGPLVDEWQVSAPVLANGVAHPHLAVRFAIRSYRVPGSGRPGPTRVDVTVENNWAYEPDPRNVTYDAEVVVNNQVVYNKAALSHFHHARWRKVFWSGAEPKVHVKHDIAYLLGTRALPNYDRTVVPSQTGLARMKTDWEAADSGPMAMPLVNKYMPSTGGRPDIGLQHAWAATYLLSMDARARQVTVGLGDLAGSWPVHYRDKNTDQVVSIIEYPYVRDQRIGSDSYNPLTQKHEDMPRCTSTVAGACSTPYTPDSAHQPSFAYLPYLLTGDTYYLDELQFWANWNLVTMNPHYRALSKGLVKGNQVRGQAWSLRTLGHAAYITPDAHPMKAYFNQVLKDNLDFYNTTFAGSATNQLGFIDNTATSYAVAYSGPTGPSTGVAPWMDDFFTSTVGHLDEMGFTAAQPILAWKARFPVGRMMASGYCWIDGAVYALMVRPSATSAYFTSFAEAYQATMRNNDGSPMVNSTGARYLEQPCGSQAQANWRTQVDKDANVWRSPWLAGEMTGYATSPEGYPSNMQPALAMAAATGIPNAREAWTRFINRSVKPNYSERPQFAIVPR
ncbi:hypothetical protein [Duganella sp. Root198D2]|uniref:hypothetical protein n=1 Tax=Duganella sp. Root198D2 TaxID=1736489 RepID=UPI00070E64D2|nr:hypothetical protein [Duganella sp. Root198D2]KRB83566.1 hypothetical protein ASE26_10330 [Duganella sp. Root198D2]